MTAQRTVIVLAAGQGTRFAAGTHKLAQTLGDSSVLASTLANALASRLHVVVVTTAGFAEVARSSVAARDVVVLPEVASGPAGTLGMGVSIAAGVACRPHARGWLVLPGDMPLVRPGSMLAVANALEQHPVVYAQHKGRRGHPVAFAAELYSELILLNGDDGARRVMLRYPAHGQELDDPGVLLDVDTKQDLERLRQASGYVQPAG